MRYLFLLCSFCLSSLSTAQLILVERDGGTYGGNTSTKLGKDVTGWEESVFLQPKGPCQVDEIYVYLDGSAAGTLELWIVGDPSEGAVPGTAWVRSFNKLCEPIALAYSGTPGWDTIDVRGLGIHSDGYDRICIQHTVEASEGPFFALDKASSSAGSFLVNPDEPLFDGLTIPGKYYLANGNFLVRMGVRYDYPKGTGSENPPAPTFVNKTAAVGLLGSDGKTMKSARVSIADWTGDGFDDIVTANQFFRNKGDGTFENVSSTIGIAAAGGGITFGDVNNDGFIDAYAVNGGAGDKIYKNNGDGTFTDITAASGITNENPTVTPIWFDYDRDGWLDLYIANGRTESSGVEVFFPDQLWHNKGDGSFENVTEAAGLDAAEPSPYYDCWGATPGDYDGDGWTDIFVATYRLAPDLMLHNLHNGTFSDEGESTGLRGTETADPSYFGHGIGCEWGDFNNDGLPDLCVGNLSHPDWRGQYANPSLIFKNKGAGQVFEEEHLAMGLKFFELNAGAVWLDLDLDGYLDLWHSSYAYNAKGSGEPYRRSRMYINEGPGRNFHLHDMTWHLGCNVHGAWTAARGDLDGDGDPDLIAASPTDTVKFFRNDVPPKGKWLAIRLKGDPAQHVNMDGYGTSVKVYAAGKLLYRDLMGGGSGATASQNSNELLFGLGDAAAIDSAVFTWPDGSTWVAKELKPQTHYTIGYPNKILKSVESVKAGKIPNAGITTFYANGKIELDLITAETIHDVRLEVTDVLGRRVLLASYADLGSGKLALEAKALGSGTYFVKLRAKEGELTAKFQAAR